MQANYLKHGDSSKTNSLSVEDQGDLWEGIRSSTVVDSVLILTQEISDKPALYSRVNVKLQVTGQVDPKSNVHRHLPVRILRPGQPPMQEPIVSSDVEGMNESTIAALTESVIGKPRTLGSVLNSLLPAIFPVPDAQSNIVTLLVQGITPPFDSSISWLCENFAHPDNFLYIIILPVQP